MRCDGIVKRVFVQRSDDGREVQSCLIMDRDTGGTFFARTAKVDCSAFEGKRVIADINVDSRKVDGKSYTNIWLNDVELVRDDRLVAAAPGQLAAV